MLHVGDSSGFDLSTGCVMPVNQASAREKLDNLWWVFQAPMSSEKTA